MYDYDIIDFSSFFHCERVFKITSSRKLHDVYRYVYTHIGRSILQRNILYCTSVKRSKNPRLSPVRSQKSAREAKRAINCPLTRLIDRYKLRSIYIFLKNSNFSRRTDFIMSDIRKVLRRMHRKFFVEYFSNYPVISVGTKISIH